MGRPPKRLDMKRALQSALDEEAEQVLKDYQATVRTFKRKPEFVIEEQTSPQAKTVSTDDEIYGYLDRGTRPHVIRPKNASVLAFNTKGFKAKSKPNSVVVGKGKKAKPPKAYRLKVKHPGFRARRFSKLIAVKMRRRFPNRVKRHIAKEVKA